MQTYTDKLQELGKETLEENKKEIKEAIKESQIEIIKKAPQYLDKLIDMFGDIMASSNDADEE